MKTCSLNDFLQELNPWLDKDHIKEAFIDEKGHFALIFQDGMKNVYAIDVSVEMTTGLVPPGNLEAVLTNGRTIPVPKDSVDIAFGILGDGVVYHVANVANV